jgi:phage terminase large subunit GpA-like protein
MMPMSALGLDEVDRYPIEIEGEGDPLKITEARTTTFPNRKIFLISSPTIESLSRINKEYLASDQRKYLVPCPHCGHEHELLWENLHYDPKDTRNAQMACPECGGLFDDKQKQTLLEQGRWQITNPDSKVPGFHISGLYAPVGLGKTWAELAEEFEEVKYDPTRLKVFKNTRLGLCEKDPQEKLEYKDIMSRSEDYPLRTLPEGCLEITCGIDVQHKYFAVQLLGWGANNRRWVLDYVEIPGNAFLLDGYKDLTAYLKQPLEDSVGNPIQPISYAIDSSDGKTYEAVLEYVRSRPVRGLFAIKGANTRGRPIIGRPSKVEYQYNGKQIPGGMEQWQIGVDTAKQSLFARLQSDGEAAYPEDRLIHFSDNLPEFYYVQLTAEIYDPNRARWVKIRQRNEALDTFVYAEVAGHHAQARLHARTNQQWQAKAEKLKQPSLFDMASPDQGAQIANESAPKPQDTAPKPKKRIRGRMR